MTDRDKPRICKVLGVEVGEDITYVDANGEEIGLRVLENGNIELTFKGGMQVGWAGTGYVITQAINHPDRIIRKPRFTEEEVAAAKMLLSAGAKSVYKDEHGGLRWKSENFVDSLRNMLPAKLFPSLLPGQSVALADICGC